MRSKHIFDNFKMIFPGCPDFVDPKIVLSGA